MVVHSQKVLQTEIYNQFILLTQDAEEAVRASQIKNGLIYVITKHTTTGITVNESLECLESDIANMLERFAPEDFPYSHARMLPTYGSTAGNPTGHLKSHITGNHCVMPVVDGRINRGDAQDIYFLEFDGPAMRTVSFVVMGE